MMIMMIVILPCNCSIIIFLSFIDDRDDSTVLRNVLTANVLYSNDDNDFVGDDT